MINEKIREIVGKLLIEYGTNITNGTSHASLDECVNILSSVAHVEMSKEEVCDFLNLSRSRFDDLVRDGTFPRGKKVKHKNNLIWYKDEIILAVNS